jgi:hypothetical protein
MFSLADSSISKEVCALMEKKARNAKVNTINLMVRMDLQGINI